MGWLAELNPELAENIFVEQPVGRRYRIPPHGPRAVSKQVAYRTPAETYERLVRAQRFLDEDASPALQYAVRSQAPPPPPPTPREEGELSEDEEMENVRPPRPPSPVTAAPQAPPAPPAAPAPVPAPAPAPLVMITALLDKQAKDKALIQALGEENARLQEAVNSQAGELTRLRRKLRHSRVRVMEEEMAIRTATQGLRAALERLVLGLPGSSKQPLPPPPPTPK